MEASQQVLFMFGGTSFSDRVHLLVRCVCEHYERRRCVVMKFRWNMNTFGTETATEFIINVSCCGRRNRAITNDHQSSVRDAATKWIGRHPRGYKESYWILWENGEDKGNLHPQDELRGLYSVCVWGGNEVKPREDQTAKPKRWQSSRKAPI